MIKFPCVAKLCFFGSSMFQSYCDMCALCLFAFCGPSGPPPRIHTRTKVTKHNTERMCSSLFVAIGTYCFAFSCLLWVPGCCASSCTVRELLYWLVCSCCFCFLFDFVCVFYSIVLIVLYFASLIFFVSFLTFIFHQLFIFCFFVDSHF